MEDNIALSNVGIAYPNPKKYSETKSCTNRLHVPLTGKIALKSARLDTQLVPGYAYLMTNSDLADLVLYEEEPYLHFFMDFQSVPPIKGKDVICMDLEKDEIFNLLVKVAMSVVKLQKHDRGTGHVSPRRDHAVFAYEERILKAMISHVSVVYSLQFVANEKLSSALDFIAHNYNRPLHNEDIANAIHVDIRYLSRLFEKHIGVPPYHYLTQYRIDIALRELRNGRSVSETAYLCGFQSENTFREAFKRVTGTSPSEILRHID